MKIPSICESCSNRDICKLKDIVTEQVSKAENDFSKLPDGIVLEIKCKWKPSTPIISSYPSAINTISNHSHQWILESESATSAGSYKHYRCSICGIIKEEGPLKIIY